MDPYAVLGLHPGASKAEIKKAFFGKAKQHHPDMHTTAPESVKKVNDAAFRVLNEAYQALMDGSHRQRSSAGFPGRSGFGRGPGGGYYGSAAAGGAAGRGAGQYYDPFQTYYSAGTGSRYSGWQQYRRRGGLDFRGTFRAFTSIGRGEVAATATLGLLLAGGMFLMEDTSRSLWERNNDGKLFDGIQRDYEHKKQQKERAAEEAAAALRAATAAMRAQAAAGAAAQQPPPQQQQAAAALAVTATTTSGNAALMSSSGGEGAAGKQPPPLLASPAAAALAASASLSGSSSSERAAEAAAPLAPAQPAMPGAAASNEPAL